MGKLMVGLMALAVAVTACASDQPAAGGDGGGTTITIQDFAFGEPGTVGVGTTVTATNDDATSHTWTSNDGLWDSGTLNQGDSFDHTFDQAGAFNFFCKFHENMTGSITVEG